MNDRSRPAFGMLAQAIDCGGNLTSRERRSLLAPILRSPVSYTTGRLRMALGLAAGADAEKSARIAEGIALHITRGIGFERGPLAPLIAAGALVDLAALRLGDLPPELVAAAFMRWPRAGCKRHLAACWRREARGVPQGRAATTARYALFSLVVRLAPFAE